MALDSRAHMSSPSRASYGQFFFVSSDYNHRYFRQIEYGAEEGRGSITQCNTVF